MEKKERDGIAKAHKEGKTDDSHIPRDKIPDEMKEEKSKPKTSTAKTTKTTKTTKTATKKK